MKIARFAGRRLDCVAAISLDSFELYYLCARFGASFCAARLLNCPNVIGRGLFIAIFFSICCNKLQQLATKWLKFDVGIYAQLKCARSFIWQLLTINKFWKRNLNPRLLCSHRRRARANFGAGWVLSRCFLWAAERLSPRLRPKGAR